MPLPRISPSGGRPGVNASPWEEMPSPRTGSSGAGRGRFADHLEAGPADLLRIDLRPAGLGRQQRILAIGQRQQAPSPSNTPALQPVVPMSSPR